MLYELHQYEDYREIEVTQGSLNNGYLSVDKEFFTKDSWGNSKQKIIGTLFNFKLLGESTEYMTDYDLNHHIIRKRIGSFYKENNIKPMQILYLYRVNSKEYLLTTIKMLTNTGTVLDNIPTNFSQKIENTKEDRMEIQKEDELQNFENEDDNEQLNINPLERRITHVTKTPTIFSLHENYKDGDLILNPDYQRYYVWDRQKASNLIESVILNIPIPVIFTSEDQDIEEVIDGQQRLQSIFSFIEGKFPDGSIFKLSPLKILGELSGKKYSELDASIQKRIKKRELTIIRIQSETQEDIKFEMFERLNTNITKLNAQELRNCLYRGPYIEFIKKMAKHNDFLYIIDQTESDNKRMLHEELVSIFCAFFHKSYLNYSTPLKQFLNSDMKHYRNSGAEEYKTLEYQFKKSVDLIKTIFDKNAFKIFSVNEDKTVTFSKIKVNQGLFFILMWSFTQYEKNQVMPYIDLINEELLNLQTHNSDFLDTLTGSGTNSKEKIEQKFDIWRNTLKGILGYPIKEPRAFTNQIKKQLWEKDSACAICGQRITSLDTAEVDHITCFWQGGKTVPENARLAHRICNRIRGGAQI